jgi:hypothetical protein
VLPATAAEWSFIMIINNDLPLDEKVQNEADSSINTDCTCPKTDCEWHGKCKECVSLHNSGNDHIPACLHSVIHDKLNNLAGVIEMKITKKENKD